MEQRNLSTFAVKIYSLFFSPCNFSVTKIKWCVSEAEQTRWSVQSVFLFPLKTDQTLLWLNHFLLSPVSRFKLTHWLPFTCCCVLCWPLFTWMISAPLRSVVVEPFSFSLSPWPFLLSLVIFLAFSVYSLSLSLFLFFSPGSSFSVSVIR